MKSVGRQLGRVALRSHQAAQGIGHVVDRDPRGVGHRGALEQLDRGAARCPRRAAAVGVEAGLGDPVALDPDRDADQITAGRAPGRAGVRPAGQGAEAARGGEVVFEMHW